MTIPMMKKSTSSDFNVLHTKHFCFKKQGLDSKTSFVNAKFYLVLCNQMLMNFLISEMIDHAKKIDFFCFETVEISLKKKQRKNQCFAAETNIGKIMSSRRILWYDFFFLKKMRN